MTEETPFYVFVCFLFLNHEQTKGKTKLLQTDGLMM